MEEEAQHTRIPGVLCFCSLVKALLCLHSPAAPQLLSTDTIQLSTPCTLWLGSLPIPLMISPRLPVLFGLGF